MKPIKVTIKDLSGKQTHGATFDTHEEAQAWVDKQQAKHRPWNYQKEGVFKDKPKGVEEGFEYIESTNMFDGKIEMLCKVSKQYTGDLPEEWEDLTIQINQEKANQDNLKFLSDTDWKVLRHQDQLSLGVATSMSEIDFIALLQERQLARASIVR